MKKWILLISLLMTLGLVADEIDTDIAEATSVDELVAKMTQAQHQNRYRYMNAIKAQISTAKAEEREEKLQSLLLALQTQQRAQQGELQRSMTRSGSLNGNGGTSSGGGTGGRGAGGGSGNGNGGKH